LRFNWTRLSANGTVEGGNSGTVCTNSSHEPLLVHPSWWMELFITEWLPDPPDDVVLIDLVASHVNMVGEPRGPRHRTANAIVPFAGPELERPVEALSRALVQMRRRDVPPLMVLVLPEGSFNLPRREVEARLGDAVAELRGRLIITEDVARGWTTAFATDGPSTHLINGAGEFVWRQDGGVDAGAIARAFDEHAIDAPPPQIVPLRLRVTAGTPALDADFTDDRGTRLSLRRLRGRRVVILFWKSWSAPCLRELRRLQEIAGRPGGPFVMAVNGGERREVIADARSRHGLTVPLVHDPDQIIAAMYGVRCWPTTVSINEEGIVDRVQFGMTHEHRGDPAVPPHTPPY
jgi:peroxiredoxin